MLPEGIIWRTINGSRVAISPSTGRVIAGAGGRLQGVRLPWYDDMGPMPNGGGAPSRIDSKAEPWKVSPDLYASDHFGYQGHMDMGPDAARRMHRNKAAARRWSAELNQNAEAGRRGADEWAAAVRRAAEDGRIVRGQKVSDEAARLLGWARTPAPQGAAAKAAAERARARREERRRRRETGG